VERCRVKNSRKHARFLASSLQPIKPEFVASRIAEIRIGNIPAEMFAKPTFWVIQNLGIEHTEI
jgi:hypothetical protein